MHPILAKDINILCIKLLKYIKIFLELLLYHYVLKKIISTQRKSNFKSNSNLKVSGYEVIKKLMDFIGDHEIHIMTIKNL